MTMQGDSSLQRNVTRFERLMRAMAHGQRATAVTISGAKFDAFFPGAANENARTAVWRALVTRPVGVHVDLVLATPALFRADTLPGTHVRVTFHLNGSVAASESLIRSIARGPLVTLHELAAERWLGGDEAAAAKVAECVLARGVYACSVVLYPYRAAREAAIRRAALAQLLARGVPAAAAATQSQTFPVVSLTSLALLKDAQRWHLVVDGAHELGTEQHAEWARWATALAAKAVLKGVDLVAASDLAGTRPGYNTVHELSTASMPLDCELRALATRLLQARVDAAHVTARRERDFARVVGKLAAAGLPMLLLSRLPTGEERRANVALAGTLANAPLRSRVRQCALLVHDELATTLRHYEDTVFQSIALIVRHSSASKFTLRDWISFLAALPPRRVLLFLLGADDTTAAATPSLDEYIRVARLPPAPELAYA